MNKNTKKHRLVNKDGMKEIIIFCNGVCEATQGTLATGGWAAIIIDGEGWVPVAGGEPYTTNYKMEVEAVIGALEALREPSKVRLYTDSVDVPRALSKWKAEGSRPKEDLGKRLYAQAVKH